jgi:hypothetical protein
MLTSLGPWTPLLVAVLAIVSIVIQARIGVLRMCLENKSYRAIEAPPRIFDAGWSVIWAIESEIYDGVPRSHQQYPDLANVEIGPCHLMGAGPPDWWEDKRQAILKGASVQSARVTAPDLGFGRRQMLDAYGNVIDPAVAADGSTVLDARIYLVDCEVCGAVNGALGDSTGSGMRQDEPA